MGSGSLSASSQMSSNTMIGSEKADWVAMEGLERNDLKVRAADAPISPQIFRLIIFVIHDFDAHSVSL
jgi:hypothetical protein